MKRWFLFCPTIQASTSTKVHTVAELVHAYDTDTAGALTVHPGAGSADAAVDWLTRERWAIDYSPPSPSDSPPTLPKPTGGGTSPPRAASTID